MNTYTMTFRVRYAETDQMGIAHHSNYFIWFESGRSEFCRALNLPYGEWEKNGVFMPVVEVGCRYKSPVRYDENVTLEITLSEIAACTMTFSYKLLGESGRTAAEGWTRHAFADANGKLIRSENDFVRRIKSLCETTE